MGWVYASACLLVVLCVVIYIKFFGRRMKMSSTTRAKVVSSELRVVRDSSERREETLVVCRYEVAGRDYQIQKTLRGRHETEFPAGRELPIRYNPMDPEMAELALN